MEDFKAATIYLVLPNIKGSTNSLQRQWVKMFNKAVGTMNCCLHGKWFVNHNNTVTNCASTGRMAVKQTMLSGGQIRKGPTLSHSLEFGYYYSIAKIWWK